MNVSPVIRVRNGQRRTRVDARRLERFATCAFQRCCDLPAASRKNVRALPEISVVLVSDRRIAELHRRFMQIAGPTDVLTFHHGEIVVSAETARTNARRFRATVEDEIRLYIVHGFLHLLGFEDKTARGARAMESAQNRVLRMVGALNDA